MNMGKGFGQYECGHVYGLIQDAETGSLAWNEHPVYKGVYLKHLIKGEDTNGSLSIHLVKVEPGCILDTHTHDGKLEIHNILDGDGICMIGERKIDYCPGYVALIPAGTLHKVTAGMNGICIEAHFSPALL